MLCTLAASIRSRENRRRSITRISRLLSHSVLPLPFSKRAPCHLVSRPHTCTLAQRGNVLCRHACNTKAPRNKGQHFCGRGHPGTGFAQRAMRRSRCVLKKLLRCVACSREREELEIRERDARLSDLLRVRAHAITICCHPNACTRTLNWK